MRTTTFTHRRLTTRHLMTVTALVCAAAFAACTAATPPLLDAGSDGASDAETAEVVTLDGSDDCYGVAADGHC